MLALGALAAPGLAQTIATSPHPDHVAVTVYRDPDRGPGQAPNLRWLNGYALISETRTVALPAGETELRFEGVAGGIVPQSAIVTGLPEGMIERNRDAYLLSPATLVDRSLGARVHLRRTARATGAVRDEEAIVRTGAAGAVVLQTAAGFEALRCTGLPETIVYDGVPRGLASRPTLSVRARSARPVTATLTLSYLATGLDWQADYVATLSPDETRLSLFAWLTLANGDETGFADADTQAVAGHINHSDTPRQQSEGGPLNLRCWPQGTTSDISTQSEGTEDIIVTGTRVGFANRAAPPPPPPPPPPMAPAMVAQQEALGDLKLYRIPEPVTVAARSQKQVALLQREGVRVTMVYRRRLGPFDTAAAMPAERILVTHNRTGEGLGLPLPAGRMMLFSDRAGRPILIGQGVLDDHAVGEDVEIPLGSAPGVRSQLTVTAPGKGRTDYRLVVTNDRPQPVRFEAELVPGDWILASRAHLGRRAGMSLWSVQVPANGRVTLNYSLTRPR
jgi:hypothetical protein